jgi:ATP-dependent DNA helicase DinG
MILAEVLAQLAQAPALVVGAAGALWLEGDEPQALRREDALMRIAAHAPLVCHLPDAAVRLDVEPFAAGDLLELFAFVRPAQFCLPTPRGLAEALELPPPDTAADGVRSLRLAAGALLRELAQRAAGEPPETARLAATMARGGWFWGDAVLTALGTARDQFTARGKGGLDIWNRLSAWEDQAPVAPPSSQPVEPREARLRLADLVAAGGARPEARPTQGDYASAVTAAFLPREREDEPNVVLAEAGTGVGKTLGYIAPASLWAERNGAPVWIATFTRNLQRQIDGELDRLYPDPGVKRRRVVVRKGRENYLCVLNFQEAADRAAVSSANAIGLGLIARWALASRDGDMIGGDLPGWLADLVGRGRTARLADRRGECIYSACEHYRRCFIEGTIRRARHADIVIANHALVMIQAAMGGLDDATRPTRYVFDEGHHLFDAADGAFGAHLTGVEASDLRRWLLGAETRRSSRARGLERRIGDLLEGDEAAGAALRAILAASRELPATNWQTRVGDGTVLGPAETFLALVRQQVLARASGDDAGYGMECDVRPLNPGIAVAGEELAQVLEAIVRPVGRLRLALLARLERDAATIETPVRNRIEALARALTNRCEVPLRAWIQMLKALDAETPEAFVDWFAIERSERRETDVGLYRHYVDPTAPFAEAVLKPAHGVVMTSATLRDTRAADAPEAAASVPMMAGPHEAAAETASVMPDSLLAAARLADWDSAEARTGARHLPRPAIRAAVASPFDYPAQTRIFVVSDVARDSVEAVAAAYRELFLASDGGGLGLFTAIGRLRAVRQRLAGPLEAAGIPLYAQHVGGLDAATLVEIFRAEERSCLLGTDAVRDGVDVPGRSLRLIVFDRVPWPRPTILHRARRNAHRAQGNPANAYDDMLTRFRLKQAFGRLIRRADDRGVYVLVDSRLPSRLLGAFPSGVPVERVGLAEAVRQTQAFLLNP